MLRIAHRVENGGNGEDRLRIERYGARTLVMVADGAGGMGGGAVAAEMACSLLAKSMQMTIGGTPEFWARCLADVDQGLAREGSGGQCTAVVAEIADGRIVGASVGDSGAWMLNGREIVDLTESQHRKPLLGSDRVSPVGFRPVKLSGRLLIASDGLFKYSTEIEIAQRATGASLSDAIDKLIDGLRLRSGAFQDDVAIILVERSVQN